VKFFVAVGEFIAGPAGLAVDLPRPPSADVGDGLEDLGRRLVDREGGGEVIHGVLRVALA